MARVVGRVVSEASSWKELKPDYPVICSSLKESASCGEWVQSIFVSESSAIHKNVPKREAYPCHVCNNYFAHSKELLRHICSHDGQNLFSCPECNKTFSVAAHLKMHKLVHNDVKPYKCKETNCWAVFGNLDALKSHTADVHRLGEKRSENLEKLALNAPTTPTIEKNHCCPLCSKTYQYEMSLKFHLTLHDSSKPCNSDVLNSALNNSESLYEDYLNDGAQNRTLPVKTSSRKLLRKKKEIVKCMPVACIECGKQFPNSRNVQIHMNRHFGLKPHKCKFQWCDAAFADPGTLRRHTLTVHSGILFKCKQCEAGFKREIDLQEHTSKFHGTDKYKPNCESKSNNQAKKLVYKCEICQAEYMHQRVMLRHVRIIHGVPLVKPEDAQT